jgi:hypothetical protein
MRSGRISTRGLAALVVGSVTLVFGARPALAEDVGGTQREPSAKEVADYMRQTAPIRAEKDKLVAARAAAIKDPSKTEAFLSAARALNKQFGLATAPTPPLTPRPGVVPGGMLAAQYSYNYIASAAQYAQEASNWCGPASGVTVVAAWNHPTSSYDGAGLSQSNMASHMTTGGPGGSGTGIYDYGYGLNKWLWGSTSGGYIYKPASSSSATTFRDDYGTDIDAAWPVGLNTVEIPNGWRYNNHPAGNFTIRHFITGYGYYSSGSGVWYIDSSAGALSLPTFSNAQAYNAGDYTDIWNYLNQSGSDQRGYTW